MAALGNIFFPIFQKSSSFLVNKLTCSDDNKLFSITRKQFLQRIPTTWVSTSEISAPQHDYQFYPNDNIFQDHFPIYYPENLENIRELLINLSRGGEEEEDGYNNDRESLILVDTIQRLGMGGYCKKEIEKIMKQHYLKLGNSSSNACGYHHYLSSLHGVALSFRLLRQRGYHVSADVLENFKGKDGKFKNDLKQDIWGLLELYEASHLCFEGEKILMEAQAFSSQLLHEHVTNNKFEWCDVVKKRLRHPYHKSIARLILLTHKSFQGDARGMNTWTATLADLSAQNFLWRKHVHKHELLLVFRWWNDLGLKKEVKLARNEPVKWYTWSMAMINDDITLSEQRVQLTKCIAFIYFIDDIFDLCGTVEELTIFTEAIKEWEYDAMDMLPNYMRLCYKSLLDTTNEFGHTIYEKHGYNPIRSLKQTWASLCNSFLVEARWLRSRNLPKAEEYFANGKVSSGVHVVLLHLYFVLGEDHTKLDDITTLISSVAALLRLWDDFGTAQDEHQNGTDGSYTECLMNDQPGLQFEQAREHVIDMIEREWRRLNKESFNLKNDSSFKEAALNLARMVPLMYSYDDNQELPLLEEYVKLMLQD